ncbi:hypothetical protein NEPAR05_1442 [Nematocida parisii]|nr:hypothetical protein NEPAR05_1442 [Nematocida parisii]
MRAPWNILVLALRARAFQVFSDNITIRLNNHGIDRIESISSEGRKTISAAIPVNKESVEVDSSQYKYGDKDRVSSMQSSTYLDNTTKAAQNKSEMLKKLRGLEESRKNKRTVEETEKRNSKLPNDSRNCVVLEIIHHLSADQEKQLKESIEKRNGYLQYVYKNTIEGFSVCNLSEEAIDETLSEINTVKLNLERNTQYSLAYKQTDLPDNFYTVINSQQRLFNVKWLDSFINRYIRNGYLIKKSSLFRWYRNKYFPLQSNYTGKGVQIEILDADIGVVHKEVSGRVKIVRKYAQHPPSSHPTSIMTAAAGITTGLAKEARIVLHPVFKFGVADLSDILYVLDGISVKENKKIILLPFTGEKSAILDKSLKMFYDANIPVVVAAGNSAESACNYSPSRSKYTITVGSMSDTLYPEVWSNTGECVDTYAPGSATVGEVSEMSPAVKYRIREGTSLSAAYMAGYLAVLMQSTRVSVSEMREYLTNKLSIHLPMLLTAGESTPFVTSDFVYYSVFIDVCIVLCPILLLFWLISIYWKSNKKDPFVKHKSRKKSSV